MHLSLIYQYMPGYGYAAGHQHKLTSIVHFVLGCDVVLATHESHIQQPPCSVRLYLDQYRDPMQRPTEYRISSVTGAEVLELCRLPPHAASSAFCI